MISYDAIVKLTIKSTFDRCVQQQVSMSDWQLRICYSTDYNSATLFFPFALSVKCQLYCSKQGGNNA